MQVIWHREDIHMGLRAKWEGNSSDGLIVGYIESDRGPEKHIDRRLCIISLDDGLVMAQNYTHEEVATWLTASRAMPVSLIGRPQTEFFDDRRPRRR